MDWEREFCASSGFEMDHLPITELLNSGRTSSRFFDVSDSLEIDESLDISSSESSFHSTFQLSSSSEEIFLSNSALYESPKNSAQFYSFENPPPPPPSLEDEDEEEKEEGNKTAPSKNQVLYPHLSLATWINQNTAADGQKPLEFNYQYFTRKPSTSTSNPNPFGQEEKTDKE